jgi:hypothetical protein
MTYQEAERFIIVTIGSRLALIAIAIANWDKAAWAFQQWSKADVKQSGIMAGAVEGALVIFTYMLAQRLQANVRRLKSDPEQPTRILWAFVIFLSFLSAFCNGLYFSHFGNLANPLGHASANIIAGIILGVAAPILAGGFAYLQGEEVGVEISLREARKQREERNKRRREGRQAIGAALPRTRKPLTTSQRRQKVFELLCKDIDQSPADLGKRFGVSAQTIRNDFKALAQQGKINYKDGRVTLRPQRVARAGEK